jgi:CheY-like chemotaxis protein
VGQLTGGIAHDFNNLLMAVIGSLELVQKRVAPDPRITPLLENAMLGARRGATLTQRMLAFARRQEVKRESVDLPQLVNGMMGLMQRSLGPSVSILTQYAGVPPKVMADPNQLESALLNLAVNARDAMPDGGRITLTVEAITAKPDGPPDVAAGDYVRICVSDTGQGMDESTLAKATEPFFTTKGVGKGTGLGLSMVHGLAAQSGGTLRLKSRPAEGTTAEIWLPVAQGDEDETAVAAPPPGAGQTQPPLSILVADDDALVLMNTVAMLEDLGHTVFAASSGAEALEILDREPQVDLVVTDQAMPKMTGVQLAEAARGERPGLPVLLATGYAELPIDAAPGLPRLAKPFLQAELARAIGDVMRAAA